MLTGKIGSNDSRKFRYTTALASVLTIIVPVAAAAQESETPASEQKAESGSGSDIVVVGRRTVDTPKEQIKKEAAGIVDSITMQDIENSTDTNLAEVLGRVAGVSVNPIYGTADGGYASIRGFSSVYNSIDVDDSPIWFSSQNNRGAQIGLIPAAVVREATVSKAITVDQDPNSIGGHISLRTLRAFDGGDGTYISLGGRLGMYEQESYINERLSYRLYGAGKATFGSDNQFGVVLGFNLQTAPSAFRYGAVDSYSQVDGEDYINNGTYDDSTLDRFERSNAFYAKLEARSGDKFYGFIAGTLFDNKRVQYLNRVGLAISSAPARTTNYVDGAATFNGATALTRGYDYNIDRSAKILSAGADYQVGALTALSFRGSYTDYVNDFRTRFPDRFQVGGISGTYDITGDYPAYTINETALYDNPANWRLRNSPGATFKRTQDLNDRVTTLRGDVRHNSYPDATGFGFNGGVSFTRLDRDYEDEQTSYVFSSATRPFLNAILPAGSTMHGNAGTAFNWDSFWDYAETNGTPTLDEALTSDYKLVEDQLGLYGAVQWRGSGLTLNAGLRYERTSDTVDTHDISGGVPVPIHRRNTYGNWLPIVHASYDFSPDLRLRLAYTKTIGRPDFSSFAPGQSFSIDANGFPVITGTNPNIGPRVSTNYDASLEYSRGKAFVSVALFRKDLAREIFTQRTQELDELGVVVLTQQIPLDTGSGQLTGVELSAGMRRLSFLPAPLDGFGIQANFAYLDGDWRVVFTNGDTRTVGGLREQPRWLANLKLSYETGPILLNLEYQAKGRTFTGTFGTTAASDIWAKPSENLDFQARFEVTEDLSLVFDATNLTNESYVETTGVQNSTFNAVGAGRRYFIGFKAKF
jgi:iron complex outermembrane recepter protein